MKKLTKELQSKSVQDLQKEVQKLQEEIAKLVLEAKVRPQKDTNALTKKKKQLAVMLTLITEKSL